MMRWLCFLIFLTGCTARLGDFPKPESPAWQPTASLTQLVEGPITKTILVEGVVTTSDSTGNFYKEILIQQQDVFRISVAMYDLYALYPRGTTLAVRIEQGQVITRSKEGILTLTPAANFNGLGQILHRQPHLLPLEIPTIGLDQLDQVAPGSTVRIEGARFVDGGTWVQFSGDVLVEQRGVTAKLTTSPYALFAHQKLPEGQVDLRAIVIGKKLKISNPKTDIMLNFNITPW